MVETIRIPHASLVRIDFCCGLMGSFARAYVTLTHLEADPERPPDIGTSKVAGELCLNIVRCSVGCLNEFGLGAQVLWRGSALGSVLPAER